MLALTCLPGIAAGQRSCDDWQAVFEAVEGTVELRRAPGASWSAARPSQAICTGDAIRTGVSGRAAIRLPDRTLVRVDRESSITFAEPADASGSLLDLLRGIIHVISRDPRSLRFSTPYANAGLEGTEFTIEARASDTRVTVVEGEVIVANASASIAVGGGETATAEADRRISAASAADPFATLRWAAYFPPVLAGPTPGADAAPPAGAGARGAFFVRRAAARAAVGRFADAAADVTAALALDTANADALAVRAALELAAGDEAAALASAGAALDADPNAVPGLVALSYVHAARHDAAAAAAAARRATTLEPGNAVAWARRAELALAAGAARQALAAVEAAAAADPNLAHAHVVAGFAHLRLADYGGAAAAFERAAVLEQGAPLPHVGRGLALIRSGELAGGRDALELALALDPGNAALRGQIARIYAAEHRPALASTQAALARALDPGDPTPYLYDALDKQQRNELVGAFHDLETSNRLGAQTGLFRSSFRLNEELAVRSGGLGRVYRDLDFEQLALLAGWRASLRDARDYAPRRLLADVYSARPRHRMARVSALWQSQLLQPLNVRPVPPQLAEANMFILGSAGPSELAFNEFGALMTHDGTTLQGSAVTGDHGTRGADFELAGLHGPLSYSLGGFAFESDGFRVNNDVDQRVANALLQYRAGPSTSVFGELRTAENERGDLSLRFDPDSYLAGLRQRDHVDSVRLGIRRDVGNAGTLVAAGIRDEIDSSLSTGPTFTSESHGTSETVDVAYLGTQPSWQIQAGLRHFDQDTREPTGLLPPNERHSSAYAYANLNLTPRLTTTVGLSAEAFEHGGTDADRVNPKLGVVWQPGPATTVRAALFRTLQGPFVSKQIIQPRLEPTHVAGFNQFFFGGEGERAQRLGIGLDRRLGERLFSGLELSARETSTPLTVRLPGLPAATELVDGQERSVRGYVYWTPSDAIALGASYVYDEIDYTRTFVAGYDRLETHRLPLTLNWFHGSRLQTHVTVSLLEQQGLFAESLSTPLAAPVHGSDRFALADVGVSYRLPRRLGRLSIEARNLFDKRFNFQDVDPDNTRYFPERTISLRLTMSR